MAARDRNQFAMQAYVIVTTIVSVGLLIALGYYMFNDGTNTKKAESAIAERNSASDKEKLATTRQELLKAMVGKKQFSKEEFAQLVSTVTGDKDMDDIQKEFMKDMSLFGPNVPESDRNYTKLIANLMKRIQTLNLEVKSARALEEQQKQALDAVIKQETAKSAKAEEDRSVLAAKLNTVTANAEKVVSDHRTQLNKVLADLEESRNQAKRRENDQAAEIAKLGTEIGQLRTRNADLAATIVKLQNHDFENAQGAITGVFNGGKGAWINLGTEDRLKRGVTFTVVGRDEYRMSEAKKKTVVEVMEVSGLHSAQVKIIGDQKIPVLVGDQIYSPVWRPGQVTEIALLGRIDMNGDGKDDRDKLKELIKKNGGSVVEDVDGEGNHLDEKGVKIPENEVSSRGQMSSNTNFLVVGEKFKVLLNEDKSLDSRYAKLGPVYKDVEDRAKGIGAVLISPLKLQGYLLSESQEKTTPLGGSSR